MSRPDELQDPNAERRSPVVRPRIRSHLDDFRVEELPLYPASGEGGHTFIDVEKRGLTTEQVARRLARLAGVAARDVGYAGRKDRHAVARQRFSVPGLDPERAYELTDDGLRVIAAVRHPHKLRTGQLAANRFELVIRALGPEDAVRAQARAERIERTGLPNRYGAQRFGRAGDNAERALRLLRGARAPRDRREARFLLSALQAAVFDDVLRERPLSIGCVEQGDLAVVHASGGIFWVDDVVRDQSRAERFEISATGPIFGTRMRAPTGQPGMREAQVLARWGVAAGASLALPSGLRARGTRRPLRVKPDALLLEPGADAAGRLLRLRCTLPPGSYVTVLVEELLGSFEDLGPAGATESP